MTPQYAKVWVRLPQDGSGYPPASVEGLWVRATALGYEVESLPFFAYGIAPGDVLETRLIEGDLWYERVNASGGQSVFRVRGRTAAVFEQLPGMLADFGCSCEVDSALKMVTVGVPSDRSLDTLLYYLLTQRDAQLLDFEEGVLRHAIPAEFR